MKKNFVITLLTAAVTIAMVVPAFAGTWEQSGDSWKYLNDDGTYSTKKWQWIDADHEGNMDGTAQLYYFDSKGHCYLNNEKYPIEDENGNIFNWMVEPGPIKTRDHEDPITKTIDVSGEMQGEMGTWEFYIEDFDAEQGDPNEYGYYYGMEDDFRLLYDMNGVNYNTDNTPEWKDYAQVRVSGWKTENDDIIVAEFIPLTRWGKEGEPLEVSLN